MRMPKKEIRTIDITDLSTRSNEEAQTRTISGYAAVFNSPTRLWEDLDEVIAPGAFSRAVSSSDVRCLFNHDWSNVLGRTKSGTLRLSEDERGLKFEVDLPDTTVARDLIKSMERGDINQCSFGFIPTEETWDYNSTPMLRTIHEVELYEVSIVPLPAYEDTEAALRSKEDLEKVVEKRKNLIKKINQALEA
ncbi:HK97 family phage prohead protease [Enterococcus mundtii]|nr:HK97 family phage prohead protease [Enterococcus mundtii]MZZ61343.1 HK97 family phage prohead protease [Enterococcus mundtii]MZZ68327.1 HK97 family phage prohead protease [Enterococcus mundtii]MZZ97178.1 HK97 family phage prohead protease [Enterococcus mundtii]NAA00118.1 HK97 family phage prohead protease [Enterococcus mundtii]